MPFYATLRGSGPVQQSGHGVRDSELTCVCSMGLDFPQRSPVRADWHWSGASIRTIEHRQAWISTLARNARYSSSSYRSPADPLSTETHSGTTHMGADRTADIAASVVSEPLSRAAELSCYLSRGLVPAQGQIPMSIHADTYLLRTRV